jgi:ATP-dependent Clp protease ATP-binding subunit ClpC
MDDGVLTDSNGRKVDFKNTIIIMTSNVGSNLIKKETAYGFVKADDKGKRTYEKMKETVIEEMKKVFPPEFLNRIDDTIIFRILDKGDLRLIIKIMVDDLNKRLVDHKITLTLSEEAYEFVVDKGYVENHGARPLRHRIQDLVENPLADRLLSGDIKEGTQIKCTVKGDALDFVVQKNKGKGGKGNKELVSA